MQKVMSFLFIVLWFKVKLNNGKFWEILSLNGPSPKQFLYIIWVSMVQRLSILDQYQWAQWSMINYASSRSEAFGGTGGCTTRSEGFCQNKTLTRSLVWPALSLDIWLMKTKVPPEIGQFHSELCKKFRQYAIFFFKKNLPVLPIQYSLGKFK